MALLEGPIYTAVWNLINKFESLRLEDQRQLTVEIIRLTPELFKESTSNANYTYNILVKRQYSSFEINLKFLIELRRYSPKGFTILIGDLLDPVSSRNKLGLIMLVYLDNPALRELTTETPLNFDNVFDLFFSRKKIDVTDLYDFIRLGKDYYHYQGDLFLKSLRRTLVENRSVLSLIDEIPDNDQTMAGEITSLYFEFAEHNYELDKIWNKSYFWTLTRERYIEIVKRFIQIKNFERLPRLIFDLWDHKQIAHAIAIIELIFHVTVPENNRGNPIAFVMVLDSSLDEQILIEFLRNSRTIYATSVQNLRQLYARSMGSEQISLNYRIKLFNHYFRFYADQQMSTHLEYSTKSLKDWVDLPPRILREYIDAVFAAFISNQLIVDEFQAKRKLIALGEKHPNYASDFISVNLPNAFSSVSSQPGERF